MPTYIVHFVSGSGTSFKVGEYKTKAAIRRAQEKYSLAAGARLGLTILDKATLEEIQIQAVA